jgi:hypothetical protein
MAAITAAAIAGTAITAGTIAAGASTAAAVGGAAMSFSQAGQARAKANDATRAADKALAEAKSKLDVNFYDALGIQKEPYELQREALLASGAQALEAGRESERGAAATAGRVLMAQNEAQAGVRSAMGQDLMALEKLSAAEDSRLRDVGAQINMEEAAGAQLARANFDSMAGRATTQGIQGLVKGVESLATSIPLYMQDADTAAKIKSDATNQRIQSNAATAFAPQLKAMQPNFQGLQGLNNPTMAALQANVNQNNIMQGLRAGQQQYDAFNLGNLRASQGQYEALQGMPISSINPFDVTGLRKAQGSFEKDYTWNPVTKEWEW